MIKYAILTSDCLVQLFFVDKKTNFWSKTAKVHRYCSAIGVLACG